jgi:hypothetical protein
VAPRPAHPLPRAQPEQQLQLLGEERVVVVELVAEEREALDERPAARHDLRAPVGDEVERGELLEDAHRVVDESTVTALVRRMRRVRAAAAASTTAGADAA